MQLNCAEAVNELRVVLTAPNVPEIRQTLVQVRPDLGTETPTFRAALLLLVGPAVGFNIDRMAVRTQVPRALVAACTRRLFDNGAWQSDGPVYTWTTPDDEAFWKDVAVAEGKLCRRKDRLGRIEWAAPGEWHKAYEFTSEDDALSVAYVTEKVRSTKLERVETPEPEVIELPVARQEAAPMALAASSGLSVVSDTNVWLGAAPTTGLFPGARWLV